MRWKEKLNEEELQHLRYVPATTLKEVEKEFHRQLRIEFKEGKPSCEMCYKIGIKLFHSKEK